MRRLVASICLVLAAAISAAAQSNQIWITENVEGAVRFYVSNYGVFGLNGVTGKGSFFVPRASETSYLFGAGLWFGAQKQVNGDRKKLVFVAYNPNSGVSWARPGEHDVPELKVAGLPDTNIDPFIYNSVMHDPVNGRYLGAQIVPPWPLWLQENQGPIATPLNTGMFDPYLDWRGERHTGTGGEGVAPAIVAGVDEHIVVRYHDDASDRYEIVNGAELAGYPIGLQVEQSVYAWKEGRYAHSVLLQYHIRNISRDTLFDCVIGQVSDPDIGVSHNDHVRFYEERPEMRTAYAWSDPETTRFGTLVMALIEAPNTDEKGFVDNSERTRFRTEGRIGAFPSWSTETDPKTSTERYDFMTLGEYMGDRGGGDQRSMITSRKFSMRPGDVAHFAVMYAVLDSAPPSGRSVQDGARAIASGAGWSELEQLVLAMNLDYYHLRGFDNGSPSYINDKRERGISRLSVVPNPVADAATLYFQLTEKGDARLRLIDALGRTVLRRELGELAPGIHEQRLDLAAYPSGFYLAVIDTDAGSHPAPITIRR